MYDMIGSNLCRTCPSILVLCSNHPRDRTEGCRKEQQLGRVVIHQASVRLRGGIRLKNRTHIQRLFAAAIATPETLLASHQIGCRKHFFFFGESASAPIRKESRCAVMPKIPGLISWSCGSEE